MHPNFFFLLEKRDTYLCTILRPHLVTSFYSFIPIGTQNGLSFVNYFCSTKFNDNVPTLECLEFIFLKKIHIAYNFTLLSVRLYTNEYTNKSQIVVS